MKEDVLNKIMASVITQLESGKVPWRKSWNNAPRNYRGRKYNGINKLLLGMLEYSSPYYLTFKQVKELGGNVKKGEHGIPIVYWDLKTKKVNEDETKTYMYSRYYTVFNETQCEGIKLKHNDTNTFKPSAEEIVNMYIDHPPIKHCGDRACYIPSLDEVRMPPAGSFVSSDKYYAALFHELVHSTGHTSRLNRDDVMRSNKFGTESYATEELVAEIGSCFLLNEAGIDIEYEDSASYLTSWLSRLKEDPHMLVSAAARADKAYNFIVGRVVEEELQEAA